MKEPSKRVKDILAKMSLEDKAIQLSCILPAMVCKKGTFSKELADKEMPHGMGRMTQFATAFTKGPRQAAEAYNAIQKYAMDKSGLPVLIQCESSSGTVAADATIFPVPIGISCSFEPELAYKMGKVIGDEGRAIGPHAMMSPVADINRDARWGRVDETFGEDPLVTSRFASEEVHGIQGEDYTKRVTALAKHWVAYGASEGGINCATINVGPKELFEVYATPFAAAIKEHDMQSIMVTYSDIDGRPMSVNSHYTRDILRDQLGFNGIAVCDGLSIPRCIDAQGMFEDRAELAGAALKAGIDSDTMLTTVYNHIVEGVNKGVVDVKDVDEAVLRTLTMREELGLLDNPYVDPDKAEKIYADPEADRLSYEIAQKSVTLLKNDGILPLDKNVRKIAVVGPFADRISTFFGGYAYPTMVGSFVEMSMNAGNVTMEGFQEMMNKMFDMEAMKAKMIKDPAKPFKYNLDNYLKETLGTKSLKEALAEAYPEAEVVCHCQSFNSPDYKERIREALEVCKDADVVILAVGEITATGGEDVTSGEGVNNPDLTLPFHQGELVKEVNALGKKAIMVLFNGRPLALKDEEPLVNAIVDGWYPGPAGGEVIANVLSGKFNPEGHLTTTFPQISSQCPLYYGTKTGSGYMDKNQKPVAGVLQPLYPFGYGLSYTTFEVGNMVADKEVKVGDKFRVKVDVRNTGDKEGADIVQIYTHSLKPTIIRPVKELRGFKKVHLKPGETKTVEFTFDTRAFGYFNAADEFVIENRPQAIYAGDNSSDISCTAEIEFTGETKEILYERVFDFEVKVN